MAQAFNQMMDVRPRVGDSLLDMLSHMPDQRAVSELEWRRAFSGEAFTVVRAVRDPQSKRDRHFELKFSPLRDARGRLIAAFQIVYDVTERIEGQKQLATAEDALRQS